MIDIESINPVALPSLPVASRKGLPVCSSIYFVLEGDEVVYIGRSGSLKRRWANHHRLRDISSDAKIAWIEFKDSSLLADIESMLIDKFNPTLNFSQTAKRDPNTPMIIRRAIDIEIEGLLERIKQARRQSPLSVTNLASDAGMSVANWYRIESGKIESLPESTLRAMESALGVDLGVTFEN